MPLRTARYLIPLRRFAEARACLERAAKTLSDADFVKQCPAPPRWIQIDLKELTPDVLVAMRDTEIPNLLKSCTTQGPASQQ